VKQLEDDYVHFIVMSFFFLTCQIVTVTAKDTVGHFLRHSVHVYDNEDATDISNNKN